MTRATDVTLSVGDAPGVPEKGMGQNLTQGVQQQVQAPFGYCTLLPPLS
jgi:hypothetical protein